jgi:hypothetical protein
VNARAAGHLKVRVLLFWTGMVCLVASEATEGSALTAPLRYLFYACGAGWMLSYGAEQLSRPRTPKA